VVEAQELLRDFDLGQQLAPADAAATSGAVATKKPPGPGTQRLAAGAGPKEGQTRALQGSANGTSNGASAPLPAGAWVVPPSLLADPERVVSAAVEQINKGLVEEAEFMLESLLRAGIANPLTALGAYVSRGTARALRKNLEGGCANSTSPCMEESGGFSNSAFDFLRRSGCGRRGDRGFQQGH
jgi:hypothetical protein